MCMIDTADYVDVCNREHRTCRKERKCSECWRVIRKGERYKHVSTFMRGKGWNKFFTCEQCQHACDWLIRECGGWCYGAVLEDLQNHWDEERIHTMELGRLIVGMKRKWTRKDGNRMRKVNQ